MLLPPSGPPNLRDDVGTLIFWDSHRGKKLHGLNSDERDDHQMSPCKETICPGSISCRMLSDRWGMCDWTILMKQEKIKNEASIDKIMYGNN